MQGIQVGKGDKVMMVMRKVVWGRIGDVLLLKMFMRIKISSFQLQEG